jgi:hypothetical protein
MNAGGMSRWIRAIKAFEDAFLHFRLDADPRVANLKDRARAILVGRKLDHAISMVILNGVVEQVHQHFPELRGIRFQFER